jgi:hypothetical protein
MLLKKWYWIVIGRPSGSSISHVRKASSREDGVLTANECSALQPFLQGTGDRPLVFVPDPDLSPSEYPLGTVIFLSEGRLGREPGSALHTYVSLQRMGRP